MLVEYIFIMDCILQKILMQSVGYEESWILAPFLRYLIPVLDFCWSNLQLVIYVIPEI